MDRRIIDYLPPALREVPELAALMAAQQPEIEALWAAQDGALGDQFLVSAADYGISRWERILRIFPKDTDGLEMRRARVLSKLRLQPPYTLPWLRNWLDELCGDGNYELAVTGYAITLSLGLDNLPEADKLAEDIMALLHLAKPANMALDFNGMRKSSGMAAAGGMTGCAVEVEVWPRT